MDLNESALGVDSETPIQKQASNGMRVRDMIRKYNTALKSESAKTSYSSIISTKSAYFGVSANIPVADSSSSSFFDSADTKVQDLRGSPSRISSESERIVRPASIEMQNDVQIVPLEKQKSFMNLSRTGEPPKAAPREKKPRHSAPVLDQQEYDTAESSYQSVRIIIDIFFDQNKEFTVQDVIGSRVETDIPPSKILTEFQKRITQSTRN